jgi:hypothetical protein
MGGFTFGDININTKDAQGIPIITIKRLLLGSEANVSLRTNAKS